MDKNIHESIVKYMSLSTFCGVWVCDDDDGEKKSHCRIGPVFFDKIYLE